MLRAGANDLGGTLMEETISRMAGSEHGSAKTVAELGEIGAGIGRPVRERTTTYGVPPAADVPAPEARGLAERPRPPVPRGQTGGLGDRGLGVVDQVRGDPLREIASTAAAASSTTPVMTCWYCTPRLGLQAQPVRDDHDDQGADDGVARLAAAAEERRAADDRCGDREQQDVAGAEVQRHRVRRRGQQDAAEGAERRAERRTR